jgi:hypothetical protein
MYSSFRVATLISTDCWRAPKGVKLKRGLGQNDTSHRRRESNPRKNGFGDRSAANKPHPYVYYLLLVKEVGFEPTLFLCHRFTGGLLQPFAYPNMLLLRWHAQNRTENTWLTAKGDA